VTSLADKKRQELTQRGLPVAFPANCAWHEKGAYQAFVKLPFSTLPNLTDCRVFPVPIRKSSRNPCGRVPAPRDFDAWKPRTRPILAPIGDQT
jgi:hypothetical protein